MSAFRFSTLQEAASGYLGGYGYPTIFDSQGNEAGVDTSRSPWSPLAQALRERFAQAGKTDADLLAAANAAANEIGYFSQWEIQDGEVMKSSKPWWTLGGYADRYNRVLRAAGLPADPSAASRISAEDGIAWSDSYAAERARQARDALNNDGVMGALASLTLGAGLAFVGAGALADFGAIAAEAAAPAAVAEVPATIPAVELGGTNLYGVTLQSSGFGASVIPDVGALSLTPTGAIQAGATPWLSSAPAGSVFSFTGATPAISAFNLVPAIEAAAAAPALSSPPTPSSPAPSATSAITKATAALQSAGLAAAKSLFAPKAEKATQTTGAVKTDAGAGSWLPLLLAGGVAAALAFVR